MTKKHLTLVRDESSAPAAPAELPPLTGRQIHILAVIRVYSTVHGYPPTLAEIGHAVALRSPSAVLYQVRQLEAKGYLRRDTTKARALALIEPRASQVAEQQQELTGGAV